MSKIVFIDFDGTIVKEDSLDILFKHFAKSDWIQKDKLWEENKIGSYENLKYAFSTFKVTKEKLDFIISKLHIREGFFEFINFLEKKNMQYFVVSEGIDYVIKKVTNIPSNKIISNKFLNNKIIFQENFSNCKYLDKCKRCAFCKVNFIKQFKNFKIYIGNGLSDRFAIKEVDLVFATSKLYELFPNAIYFENFFQIKNHLKGI